MMNLDGQRVLLIGAGGLLGRTFATALIEAGARVLLADRALAAVEELAASLGERAVPAAINITDADSIRATLALADQTWGGLDTVVNTAYPRNPRYGRRYEEVEYDDFCENLGLHLGGYHLVMQQAALYFRAHGKGGHIVNISSIYGVMQPRFEVYAGTAMTMPVEYAAIKSALVHLSGYVAKYFLKDGVRVNCISPGGIRDRQPESFLAAYDAHAGRIGMLEPQDIASTLLYLLSPASRGINGQNIVVDDGFSL